MMMTSRQVYFSRGEVRKEGRAGACWNKKLGRLHMHAHMTYPDLDGHSLAAWLLGCLDRMCVCVCHYRRDLPGDFPEVTLSWLPPRTAPSHTAHGQEDNG